MQKSTNLLEINYELAVACLCGMGLRMRTPDFRGARALLLAVEMATAHSAV